ANLGNLTFRFLRCCVEFWAEHFTGRVLKAPDIGPPQLLYGSNELAVADVEAEWIEVTFLKATLSLVERRQRGVLVRLYSGGRLVEHSPGFLGRTELTLLRERRG